MDGFLAGAAGGVTAAAITYPLDTIRARLAFQVTSNTLYSGIKHVAVRMFKEVRIMLIKIIYERHIVAFMEVLSATPLRFSNFDVTN
jgi:hypothetical protein